MPDAAKKVSTKTLPDWIVNFASLFSQYAKEGRLFLEISRNVSNAKAKTLLGWKPIANNEKLFSTQSRV